jgi:CubicO group peptidase (beta-lactamase class C family)
MKANRQRLEEYIRKYLALWDFYGVIQVVGRGDVLFENAYGYANIEFGLKNTMNSRFTLASVSKQLTAFAVMLLADRNMLDLDRSARLYLPAEMEIDEAITVHHLLSHTSGLNNFHGFEHDFLAGYNRLDYSRTDFFHRYINRKPTTPPGTAYDYNNSNYNLLAWVIEEVSGEKYEDFMRDQIFLPLGMTSTEADDGSKVIRNRSLNYVRDFDAIVHSPYHNEKFGIGAGAIVSTCADLYRWYEGMRDRRMLSQQAHARFFQENQNHYCYGLEHHRLYATDRFSHGGDYWGVSTYVQYFFEEDISVIILSNNEAIHQYRLGQAISDILHDVDVSDPTKPEEVPMDEGKLREYCGTYLKDKIEVEMMDGKMYFTRFAGNIHIELYPVGEGRFARRYTDKIDPYRIVENEKGEKTFLGYAKKEG